MAEEVCLDGTTVMGIKDLVVETQEYGRINVDVDFRLANAFEVYGSRLGGAQFKAQVEAKLRIKLGTGRVGRPKDAT